jgi:aspartate/methionine/tyrosine aminotransferase
VCSDECYVEFTWEGGPRTILQHGTDGLLAVHSLSKRSNLAGVRVGFYAGDPELVGFVSEIRKHAGAMVPGPAQAAGAVALDDDPHVDAQRERYRQRLVRTAEVVGEWSGIDIALPDGGFYLWFRVGGDEQSAWDFAHDLARDGGTLVTPGDTYGAAGAGHVRIAVVATDDRIDLMAARLAGAGRRADRPSRSIADKPIKEEGSR